MTLFEIKNLVCSYDGKHPVLYISELDIPEGEICILFGKSGSGKSTLLETLGLMTNTIASSKVPIQTVYHYEGIQLLDDMSMELKFHGRHIKEKPEEVTYVNKSLGKLADKKTGINIWENSSKQRKLQQRLRAEYFAFIFQSTNLMPNFSAEENSAIPEMIDLKEVPCKKVKSNCPYKEYNDKCDLSNTMCAIVHARQTLDRDLKIPKHKLWEPARSFSGGQQQRITFARAHNSHFSVLFGDEPTGNLDNYNSKELMRVIRKLIDDSKSANDGDPGPKSPSNNPNNAIRSAVIVSHSIDLTLQFANRIVFLETKKYNDPEDPDKKAEQYYGKIDSKLIYVSDSPTEDEKKRIWKRYNADVDEKPLSYYEMDDMLTKFLREKDSPLSK